MSFVIRPLLESIRARASRHGPVEMALLATLVDNPFADSERLCEHVRGLLSGFFPEAPEDGDMLDAIFHLRQAGDIGEDLVAGPDYAGPSYHLKGDGMLALIEALNTPVPGFSRNPAPFFLRFLLVKNLRLQTDDARLRAVLRRQEEAGKFRYQQDLAVLFGTLDAYRDYFSRAVQPARLIDAQLHSHDAEIAETREKDAALQAIEVEIEGNWDAFLEADVPPEPLNPLTQRHTFATTRMSRALFLKQVEIERRHHLLPYLEKMEADRRYLEALSMRFPEPDQGSPRSA